MKGSWELHTGSPGTLDLPSRKAYGSMTVGKGAENGETLGVGTLCCEDTSGAFSKLQSQQIQGHFSVVLQYEA